MVALQNLGCGSLPMKCRSVLVLSIPIVLMMSGPGWSAMPINPSAAMNPSDERSDRIGTLDEYEQRNPNALHTSDAPLIGIRVAIGRARFDSGASLDGLAIIYVRPDSPAARAGLQSEWAATKVAFGAAGVAAAVLFPPAILGVLMLHDALAHGTPEVIVAVDADRTRDITDFETAIARARPGEVVYLATICNGRRKQFRVALPAASTFSQSSRMR
jgi:hypothetical protein